MNAVIKGVDKIHSNCDGDQESTEWRTLNYMHQTQHKNYTH